MLCEWHGGTYIGTDVHRMLEAYHKLNGNSSFSLQMATVLKHYLWLEAVSPIDIHGWPRQQEPGYFEPRATVYHLICISGGV